MKKYIKKFNEYNDIVSTSYDRTIPRDFFNEAKLLKCMGLLCVKILDRDSQLKNIDIIIEESGEPFNIELTNDGELLVANYGVTINGDSVLMKTNYNSKDNFPLYCGDENYGYDDVLVFDENGKFTDEFIERYKKDDV